MTSGSDDLANLGYLGHFLMGQVGLIHKLKLCGCDLDVTCTLENSVGMWQLSELFSSHVTLLSTCGSYQHACGSYLDCCVSQWVNRCDPLSTLHHVNTLITMDHIVAHTNLSFHFKNSSIETLKVAKCFL